MFRRTLIGGKKEVLESRLDELVTNSSSWRVTKKEETNYWAAGKNMQQAVHHRTAKGGGEKLRWPLPCDVKK